MNHIKMCFWFATWFLMAGCGDTYWLLNNSGTDAEINGTTVKKWTVYRIEGFHL